MNEEMLVHITRQLDILIELLSDKEKQKTMGKMGRPTKEQIVKRYQESYPSSSKRKCVRVTGLNPRTVRKYWQP